MSSTIPVERNRVATDEEVTRVFSISIVISAIRCTFAYVIFPWVLPALGVAGDIGPGIGLVVGAVAIASNVFSIRRFWASQHRWRYPVTVLNVGMIVLVSMLVIDDLNHFL